MTDGDLRRYRAFVEISDLQSFSEAAKIIGVSQSSISRMISDLEEGWGFRLFERDRNGVSLTKEGEEMLPIARKICSDASLLDEKVNSIHNVEKGHIVIGVFSSVATHWLPNIIRRFGEDHPDISYELLLGNYSELRDWVSEDRVDFAFTSASACGDADVIPIEDDELMAVIPKDNPYADSDVFPMKALTEFPFMLLRIDEDTNIDRMFRDENIEPDIRLRTWDDYSIMSMVENGLGIGILPSLILRRTPYDICVKRLEHPIYRRICIAKRRNRSLSMAAQEFLKYVKYRDDRMTVQNQPRL